MPIGKSPLKSRKIYFIFNKVFCCCWFYINWTLNRTTHCLYFLLWVFLQWMFLKWSSMIHPCMLFHRKEMAFLFEWCHFVLENSVTLHDLVYSQWIKSNFILLFFFLLNAFHPNISHNGEEICCGVQIFFDIFCEAQNEKFGFVIVFLFVCLFLQN